MFILSISYVFKVVWKVWLMLLFNYKLFWWAVLLTLAIFSYHTTTVRWDGHDRGHGSKVGGKHPIALYWGCSCYCWGRSPGRLDLQLLMYQTCLYLWLCINGNKTLVVITFSCGLVIKALFHFHLWDYNGLWIVLILWGHRYIVYLFESSEVLCWILNSCGPDPWPRIWGCHTEVSIVWWNGYRF